MGKYMSKDINKFKHISGALEIKKFFGCNNCPEKLYAKDGDKIQYGIGNIYTDTMFVLPNYDINIKTNYDNILELLINAYKELRGKDILEEVYISRILKCFHHSSYNLENKAIDCCITHLFNEMYKHKGNNIILFGNTYDILCKYKADFDLILNYKVIQICYSPAMIFYNKDKFMEDFECCLTSFDL